MALNIRNFLSELRRRRVIQATLIYAITSWIVVQVATTVTPLLNLPVVDLAITRLRSGRLTAAGPITAAELKVRIYEAAGIPRVETQDRQSSREELQRGVYVHCSSYHKIGKLGRQICLCHHENRTRSRVECRISRRYLAIEILVSG